MEEKENVEETKEDTPKVVQDANAAAERLEKANQEKAELLSREEEMMARKALGGNSEAGQAPAKAVGETDEEYSERFREGKVNLLE